MRETGVPTLVTTEEKERAKAFEDRGKRKAWLLSDCRGSRDIQRTEDGLKTKPQKKMMLKAKKQRAERRRTLKGEKGTWFWHMERKVVSGTLQWWCLTRPKHVSLEVRMAPFTTYLFKQ